MRRGGEVLLARAALAILPRLPRRAILALARSLGTLAYAGGLHSRRVGMANLAVALPDRSVAERRHLLRTSYQTFAMAMLDVFWLARHTDERLRDLVRFDPSYEILFRPGAVICVSAHMGNWEALGMAVTQHGYPLVSVVAPLKNRDVDPLFNELRHLTGQTMVPKQGAVRHLLKHLRQGGKIALLLDQNTKPVDGGVFVEFFGLKAPVSSAPALLALRTGAQIVVGVCHPTPDGAYEAPALLHIDRSGLPEDHQAAVEMLTQRIADALQRRVADYPAHWLWSYKRWKIRPDGEPTSRYPFYTRAIRPGDLPTRGNQPG